MKNSLEYYSSKWRSESEWILKREFTDSNILRLTSTKPAKVVDLLQAEEVLLAIQKLRFFACIPGGFRSDGWHVPAYIKRKGWGSHGSDYELVTKAFYITTAAKITKLDLLIEDLEARVDQLEADNVRASKALQRSQEAAKQFEQAGQDVPLAGALWHALDTVPPAVGYVYFKRWSMPDGSCWFKVGITNNPDRRETEQNVLPVAAETIVCVDVGSMDRARSVEAVIHKVLEEQRITDANNRELFHLSDQQAAAVKAVLEKLV
jgi:hypothetical protein